jgi:hypothetical protein
MSFTNINGGFDIDFDIDFDIYIYIDIDIVGNVVKHNLINEGF